MKKLEAGEAATEPAPKKTIHQRSDEAPVERHDYEDDLLAVLMVTPAARTILGSIELTLLHGDERQQLAAYLRDNQTAIISDALPASLQSVETYGKIVQLRAESRYDGWAESDRTLEAARLLRLLEIEHKKQRKDELIDKLREAEAAGEEETASQLRAQLSTLIKETARG